MRRSQFLLHSTLVSSFIVGSFAMTTSAASPTAPEKRPAKKAESRQSATPKRESKTATAGSKKASDTSNKRDAAVSKDRAEAAVKFARKHHPELADLLEGLKKSDDRNFQAGLRVLTRDSERLRNMGERKDERYPISLELWKLDSRIRLEIARLSMSLDEDFEPRLRPLMEKRQAARVRLIKLERQRTAERLAKYDEQLKTLESKSDSLVGSEIDRLKKMMAARARTKSSRPQTSKNTASKESTTAKRKPSRSKTSRPANSPTTSAN